MNTEQLSVTHPLLHTHLLTQSFKGCQWLSGGVSRCQSLPVSDCSCQSVGPSHCGCFPPVNAHRPTADDKRTRRGGANIWWDVRGGRRRRSWRSRCSRRSQRSPRLLSLRWRCHAPVTPPTSCHHHSATQSDAPEVDWAGWAG